MYYEKHGKTAPIEGLDCSGYIKYVVKEALDINMPSMCVKYFNTFEDNNFEPIDESGLIKNPDTNIAIAPPTDKRR